ncbi:MAG: hypothetical protein ABJI43_15440 [Roseobacter sp.]
MKQNHIFFLISDQHFIPTGGIGSFFRGFQRMADHFGWQVTVVLDKPLRKHGEEMKRAHPTAAYILPEAPIKDTGYNPDTSQYAQEIPNRFKTANFVTTLQLVLENLSRRTF